MSTKQLGIGLIIVGLLIMIFMVIASPLHIIGSGFGLKHIIGIVIGAAMFIGGLILALFIKEK